MIGPLQIAVILLVILILFGKGKISSFGEELGKGIRNFKKGLDDENYPEKEILDDKDAR